MSNPVPNMNFSNKVTITTVKTQSQKINCCCNCCYCCDCCECCHCGQCINCNDCCGCKCFCCIFSKILLGTIIFSIDVFSLFFRLLAAICIGCELFPFSRLFLNTEWIGFKVPMLGCYCFFFPQCLLALFCQVCCGDDSYSVGSSSSGGSGGGGGGGGGSYGGGNNNNNSGGGGNRDWDHEPNYAYQNPSGRDDYGNPTYTRYNANYAYENPTGRDAYGNPTYG